MHIFSDAMKLLPFRFDLLYSETRIHSFDDDGEFCCSLVFGKALLKSHFSSQFVVTKSFETDKRKWIDKDAENCTMTLRYGEKSAILENDCLAQKPKINIFLISYGA